MKQYPAIYKSKDKQIYLYSNKDNYYCFIRGFWSESDDVDNCDHEGDSNITYEFLQNTWGIVESKEHAEFIIFLANTNGFIDCGYGEGDTVFLFKGNKLVFIEVKDTSKSPFCAIEANQTTIPLPPKAKEWPQVGDEVLTSDELGVIKSTADSKGFYAVLIDGEYSLLHFTEFEKPKSKQDLLIEELQTKLCNNNAVDNYILACDIINGEIEGLSYDVK